MQGHMPVPDPIAVVFGASGGVGGALVRQMSASDQYAGVIAIGRRRPDDLADRKVTFLTADITREAEVRAVARSIEAIGVPTRVVVATGLLHDAFTAPEKSMRAIDPEALSRLFAVNPIGPVLVAKHLLPLMPREQPSLFAALSARVGSISDNRLGGWYGYRASKAALNMLIATLAVEHRRTNPLGVCVALHPGTVETRLSAPFGQSSASSPRLSPQASARALMAVMDGLGPNDSGGFFAWDGDPIAW